MTVSIVTSNSGAGGSANPSVTFSGYTPALNDVVVLFPSTTTIVALAAIDAAWVNPLGGLTNVVSDTHGISCVYHLVTAGEVSGVTTTYTATGLYGSAPTGFVHGVVLRGVDTTTPVDAIATTFDSGNTATPDIIPGLLGSDLLTGSLVLASVAVDLAGTYSTAPTGWTFVQNTATTHPKATISLDTATTYNVSVPATSITPSSGDEYATITVAFMLSGATPPPGAGTTQFFAMF